eukprot:gene1497-biopygen14354
MSYRLHRQALGDPHWDIPGPKISTLESPHLVTASYRTATRFLPSPKGKIKGTVVKSRMQLTLKSRPMLHSRIQPLSLCQPRPHRGGAAASPVIRANPNERSDWSGKGGKRTGPQRGGGDDHVGGKPGKASPVKGPTGASQQGRGKSSTQFGPRRIDYQLDGSASVTPAELTRIITGCRDLTSLDQLIKVHGHNFDERHVSAAMTRVAKSERDNHVAVAQGMMHELSVLALPGLSKMDARCLSSVLWALGKVGGPVNPDLVQGILAYTKEKLASFNALDISNLMLGMASLQAPTDGIIHEIMDAGMRRLPEFNPQELANTLWALATMGIPPDGPFIDGWMYFAAAELPGFNAQALSNSLWALAKLGIDDEAFTASWLRVATGKLPEFNAQNLSNSFWAAAKLGIEDEAFTATWLTLAKLKLPGFNAQALSNSLWSAATLGIKDDAFIAAWLSVATRKLPEFNAQNLSNSLWALAKLGTDDEAFTATWLSVATRRLQDFDSQELSNILWAASKLGIEDEAFTSAWLTLAKLKLPGFNAQQLSNSLWAAVTLGIEDDAFTAAWLSVATRKLPEFNAQNLSNSLWAAAKLGFEDEALVATRLSVATRKLPEFNAQELSNSLWAADKLGIEDETFIATWLVMAKRKLLELNSIDVTQISAAILSSDSWAIDTEFKAKIAAMLKKRL